MLTIERITEMFKMQEALEIRISGKDWRKLEHNYGLCIHMECAELIEHTNWKHWKDVKKVVDMDQIALELVDIWHFALAHSLASISGPEHIPALAQLLLRDLNLSIDSIDADDDGPRQLDELAIGMGYAMMSQGHFPLANFIMASAIVKLDFDALFLLYCCKNVLNRFRQVHGYKEGVYLKTWAGREDNQHLMDIAKECSEEELNFDYLYDTLNRKYQLVVH